MLQNQSFTDPQGMHFENAVVRVVRATLNQYQNQTSNSVLTLDPADQAADAVVEENSNVYQGTDIQATYGYWVSQEAHDSKKGFYTLMDDKNGGSTTFNISEQELQKEKYDGLTLEAKCETYFTDEILPTLI